MIENNEVTILVHGPISLYTILTLYRYRADHPMVFVIPKPQWNNVQERQEQTKLISELHALVNSTQYDVSVLTYDPKVPQNCDNQQNRYLHFFSVSLGLETIKTPYTVKMRSDEFYSMLHPFIETLSRYENKIITNDVFFRKATDRPIHPSDHLIGGKTEILKNAFHLAKSYCLSDKEFKSNALTQLVIAKSTKTDLIAAEQVMGIAMVTTLFEANKLSMKDEVDAVQQSFEIVPCERMSFFRVKANSSGNREYFDATYFSYDTDIKDIRDYKYE